MGGKAESRCHLDLISVNDLIQQYNEIKNSGPMLKYLNNNSKF